MTEDEKFIGFMNHAPFVASKREICEHKKSFQCNECDKILSDKKQEK